MNTLNLTLKKKWFDMILSGEKKEEYRDIKIFWIKRLVDKFWKNEIEFLEWYKNPPKHVTLQHVVNNFKTITFKNGYASNAPEMVIEFKGIEIKEGNPDWGAEPGVKYFVISLGEILSTKNIHSSTGTTKLTNNL